MENDDLLDIAEWPKEREPYTPDEWEAIKAHISDELCLQMIRSAASDFANNRFSDSGRIDLKRVNADSEHEKQIEKYLEYERESFQGLSAYQVKQVNRWIKRINENPTKASEQCHKILALPFARFYFSDQQFQQIVAIAEGITPDRFEAIENIKARKAHTYPALDLLIRQLADIYESATGTKPSIAKDHTKDEYRSPFYRFLCDCVLPITDTHKTPKTLAEFASNILKDRRKQAA